MKRIGRSNRLRHNAAGVIAGALSVLGTAGFALASDADSPRAPADAPNDMKASTPPARPVPRKGEPSSVPEESPSYWREEKSREQLRARVEKNAWYGLPILALDLTAITMATGGGFAHSRTGDAFAYLGVGVYALGGPTVHLYEGYALRGLFDLGMRTIGPAGLFALGVYGTALVDKDWASSLVGGLGLLGVGLVAASAVDIAYLAYDNPPSPSSTVRSKILPQVGVIQDSAGARVPMLGLGGVL